MKPETAQFLDYARDMLGRANRMLLAGLYDDAGRGAYLVCFHTAQAVIFEREGRVMKTHRGVQTAFHRLMRNDARVDLRLVTVLPRSYKFKSIADYGYDTDLHPTEDDAKTALLEATRFLEVFSDIVAVPPATP